MEDHRGRWWNYLYRDLQKSWILFWRSTSADFGNYEVWVDGEQKGTLEGHFKNGWGNYAHSQEVFVSDTEAEHTITIKKAEGSVGDDFVLLKLMLSH